LSGAYHIPQGILVSPRFIIVGIKTGGLDLQRKKERGLQETKPRHIGDRDHDDEYDNEDLVPAGGADPHGAVLRPVRMNTGTYPAGFPFFMLVLFKRFVLVRHALQPCFLGNKPCRFVFTHSGYGE
jgi:hypothetical protein